MTTTTERGYLDFDYADSPYGAGELQEGFGIQVTAVVNKAAARGVQAQQVLSPRVVVGVQAAGVPEARVASGLQVTGALVDRTATLGWQANEVIAASPFLGLQAAMVVARVKATGMQVRLVISTTLARGLQAKRFISPRTDKIGVSAWASKLKHRIQQVYLEGGYMEDPNLVDLMAAFLATQARMVVRPKVALGIQAQGAVTKKRATGVQVQRVITKRRSWGIQALQVQNARTGLQASMVIYNTTQIRFLSNFASRGTPALGGNNWTASSVAAGDFSPKNLNTDIVEQVYRSTTAGTVVLACDTGLSQGVPVNTIAILGHNLSKGALVQVQGSKDNFSSIDVVYDLAVERTNMYWVAPVFPNLAGQNRYWRFVIQDPTNADGYVQIGTIVFGVADIFTAKENFDNPVVQGWRHFKDAVPTEGFTNMSNDRALKRFLKIKFNELNWFAGNYRILETLMTTARTSQKTLVIPTPEYPSRFAIFAKLTALPETTHNSVDAENEYISLELEWDESL